MHRHQRWCTPLDLNSVLYFYWVTKVKYLVRRTETDTFLTPVPSDHSVYPRQTRLLTDRWLSHPRLNPTPEREQERTLSHNILRRRFPPWLVMEIFPPLNNETRTVEGGEELPTSQRKSKYSVLVVSQILYPMVSTGTSFINKLYT